jgi:hypothetical protein
MVIRILSALAILSLASCTPIVRIDLVNETGLSIEVLSGMPAKPRKLIDGRSLLFRTTNPLIVKIKGKERRYMITSIPPKLVRTTFRGLQITLLLGQDEKLYLAEGKGRVVRKVESQPETFPVAPME